MNNNQTSFADVHAYISNPANYYRTAKERRADAAESARVAACHAAFKADWVAQGRPVDADGEPDLFAEFE